MDHDTTAAMTHKLKAAMRRMPGPVALITTRDPQGDCPAGLAASAVIPVSMAPPSMLVAVNRETSSHASIERAQRFCVNLLDTTQTELVTLFASPHGREQRFLSEQWAYSDGIPYLTSACASVFCDVRTTLLFGTHELFVGEVFDVFPGQGAENQPLGWIEGAFAQLEKLGVMEQ